MRNLHHPALPGILDVIHQKNTEWLVMEYIPGRSLQEMPAELFSKEQFFELAEQLAEVLVYLHSRVPAILHLDIKPGNLIINAEKKLILLDFGAAVMKTPYDEANPCMGTPGFAAPEQYVQNMVLDCRADIFGFGAVLNWYLSQIPDDRYKFLWGYSLWKKGIRKVIQKSMQKDRRHRYPDSRTLWKAVRREHWKMQAVHRIGKILAAVILLVTLLIFSGVSLSEEMKQSYIEKQLTCMELLKQSELLGFAAAAECYREAAGKFPEQLEWCLHLADRIAADEVFEIQEEALLKELLFQIVPGTSKTAESLVYQKKGYSYFAFRTGMNYWYYYEGSGGRNAAIRWFEKVVQISCDEEGAEEWTNIAQQHIRIQKYYEQQKTGEKNQENYSLYWTDLVKLWKMGGYEGEAAEIRVLTAKELISGIVMHSADLILGGRSQTELEAVIKEIDIFSVTESREEELGMLLEEAGAALKRAIDETEDRKGRL